MTEAASHPDHPDHPDHAGEPDSAHGDSKLITVIGIGKAFKGCLLLLAALGTFSLVGQDLVEAATRLHTWLHLDPDSRLVQWLYDKVDTITTGSIKVVASVEVVYGLLLCMEGYGLLMRRKWAEVLVIVATCLPIPVELYELVEHPGLGKVFIIGLNLFIVGYLYRRRQAFLTRAQRRALKAAKVHAQAPAQGGASSAPPPAQAASR